MDERRDPGEFYPGGRVIAREGVAPGQTIVNWSDIQGKPDFSDVAELGAADSPGTVKQTVNTIINKFNSLLIGALLAAGAALADVAPQTAALDDIPGNTPIMTNTQEYVDAKVGGRQDLLPYPTNAIPWDAISGSPEMPIPDFTTNNAELVETIKDTAPTPGNYAAVSNAAMNAVQPSSMTNYATTADTILTPIYSATPTYSNWTILRDGVDVTSQVAQPSPGPVDSPVYVLWNVSECLISTDSPAGDGIVAPPSVTTLSWIAFNMHDPSWDGMSEPPQVPYTATRTRTDILGYTLGDQTNKVLSSTNDLARASVLADIAETATNALETAGAAAAASSTNSANIATLNAQVASIGAHLNAEDAHFVSTNYDSVARLPEAYVEIKMRDEATGSNTWITIWQEMRRWTAFVGSAFDWQTWSGFHTWMTNVTHELSFKADRCWGIYDSETGGYSPEGYTQISSSNILVAAGMAYQRTITSDGAVWVLQCNQGVAHIGGDTNGFFRVIDGEGNVQFEIIKGDRREVGCNADGITVGSGSPAVLTIPYSIDADEHPTLRICDALETALWKDETDPDCLANVSWSGVSGAYVATVQRKTAGHSLFVKATYMAGGETYIRNVAPVGMDSIMLNGTRYYLGTATISGNTVLTLSTTAP
jgi:hypothetical protein